MDRSDWIATNPIIDCPATENQAQILCPSIYQPVCAYRNSDPPGTPGVTLANFCLACSNYDFYSPGACEEIDNGEGPTIIIPSESEIGEGEYGSEEEMNLTENDERMFLCDANNVQLACDSIYDPVCAYHLGNDKGTTMGNSCEACSSRQGYDFYTEGRCSSGNEEEDIQIDIEAIPTGLLNEDL